MIRCPKDRTHKQFIATAHVTQDWIVNEEGDFLDLFSEDGNGTVTHYPDRHDLYQCADCNTEAIHES